MFSFTISRLKVGVVMNYTNRQIIRILHIQDFLNTVNTLSKIYIEYDDRELNIDNIIEKQRIYILYCSSMYNLVDAIKKSDDIFGNNSIYESFKCSINQKYVADNVEYLDKQNYESNLYKILGQIRHQNNHFEKDDNDDTILFEIYIDYEILYRLNKIINELFYKVYNNIDKNKLKQLVLSRAKIRYSFDKFNKEIDYIETEYSQSTSEIDKIFAKDNERAISILREYCNPSNFFDLMTKEERALKKFELNEKEMDLMFNKIEKYFSKNGTESQQAVLKLIKDYFATDTSVTKNEQDKSIKEFIEKLKTIREATEESN